MASQQKFLQWLGRIREELAYRREQKLLARNRREHLDKRKNNDFSASRKVVESFVAPPPFLLYIWAVFPLLFIATFQLKTIIAGIIATLVNLVVIHLDTFLFVRFLLSGIVLLVVLLLYHYSVI